MGVFYGTAGIEAPALAGQAAFVIGGANSAGQAALHLATYAACVTLLVQGESLAAGMPRYLITQIAATPNIEVRLGTRLVDGHGEARLEALTVEDIATGRRGRCSGRHCRLKPACPACSPRATCATGRSYVWPAPRVKGRSP
jgi:thioredoxin reductase (NADPH)